MELRTRICLNNTRVVTGTNRVKSQCPRTLGKLSKLDEFVATNTGIWGVSGLVLINEVGDDRLLKFFRKIPYIKWNTHDFGSTSSISGIFNRTAAARTQTTFLWLRR